MRNRLGVAAGLLFAWTVAAAAAGETPLLPGETVRAENDGAEAKTVTVATFEHVPTSSSYAVRGRVRCENVAPGAYLELLNTLPGQGTYFTRALDGAGPMAKLEGTSPARAFELPFHLMDAKPASVTLTLNVRLPGAGVVELSDLSLVDDAGGASALSGQPRFFAGLAIAAAVYFAVLGMVAGLCVPKGRGRPWVAGLLGVGLAAGVGLMLAGVYGWRAGWPSAEWALCLQVGGIAFAVLLPNAFLIRQRYRQAELRKIRAMDCG